MDIIQEKGPDFVLEEVCGLSKEEELFILIKEQIIQRRMHGK
jgi:hypothetical protein